MRVLFLILASGLATLMAWTQIGDSQPPDPPELAVSIVDGFSPPLAANGWAVGFDLKNDALTGYVECFDEDWSKLWHAGEDLQAATGTQVRAVANGVVKHIHPTTSYPGRALLVEHTLPSGELIYSMYGHLNDPLSVHLGDEVNRGDVLGTIVEQYWLGKPNHHLHWEIRNFYDANFVCDKSSVIGKGYTYPNRPSHFPGRTERYFDPSTYIRTYETENIAVVLIIDATGSMNDNDPDEKRIEAAEVFIQEAQIGDKIAIVSFNTEALPVAPLTLIESQQDKEELIQELEKIGSSGWTNLNAGLNAGFEELLNDSSNNKKSAIFLTDGVQEGSGPYDPKSHEQYKEKGWPVYTVGLGAADVDLLNQIAAETGAEPRMLQDPNDLVAVYFEIKQQLTGGKVAHSSSILMTQGSSHQEKVSILNGQREATFFTAWAGSEVSMSLTAPNGWRIDSTTTDRYVSHVKGNTYEIYSLEYPEAGQWSIDLYGVSLPSDGEVVDIRVATAGLSSVYLPSICNRCGDLVTKPPSTPANPVPSSGASGQGVNIQLQWSGDDPDGDLVTYDVYIGHDIHDAGALVCSNISDANCDSGTLQEGTEYVWRVIATDSFGKITYGPLWSFSTEGAAPPSTPTPTPAATPTPTPTPTPTEVPDQLAFVSDRDGDNEIYLMDISGSWVVQLTDNTWEDEGPSWSGNASGIVFHSNQDGYNQLYMMDADGTDQTRFLNSSTIDEWPSWSPDSNKIAFSRIVDSRSEVFVVDANGSGVTRMTYTTGSTGDFNHGCWPSGWSPDSARILYYCYLDGYDQLWMMNADGSNQHKLTSDAYWNAIPTLSPDGSQIAFASFRDGNYETYIMDADGTHQTRLTFDAAEDWRPRWSEDGSKIIFESQRDGRRQIYWMNLDGSNQVRLTDNTANDHQPAWRPKP